MSSQPTSFLDNLRLLTCVTLLRFYVIPKTKLRASLARLFGSRSPTLQHMLANASVRWAVTSGPVVEVRDFLQYCPNLLDQKVKCMEVTTSRSRGLYVTRYPDATHIIFYIHGGGFVSGSPEATSPYLLQLGVELQARGIRADIFSAGYDLAPESPFPGALRQIVSMYQEHLSRQEKPIIMASDSAGGNLTLAFLRHLVDPHPEVPPYQKREGDGQIVAACLASPWVNLFNIGESMRKNAGHDCLDKPALDRWRDAYLGGRPLDCWASPASYQGSWRDVLPGRVLLMSGEVDMFLSDVVALTNTMRRASLGTHNGGTTANTEQDGVESVELRVEPLKGHVWHLIDFGATVPGREASSVEKDEAGAYHGVVIQADWIAGCCTRIE